MKKILSALLAAILAFSSFSFADAASIIYSKKDTTYLSKGLILDKYKILLSDRSFLDAFVVTADLNCDNLSISLLTKDDKTSKLETVRNLAESAPDVRAAVNSDFFSWGAESGTGSPIGAVVKEGNLLSGCTGEGMYALMQSMSDEKLFIDFMKTTYTITAPNGLTHSFTDFNKYTDLSKICMRDSTFNGFSFGAGGGMYEIIIKDGTVIKKTFDSEPVPLEEGMYAIAALMDFDTFIYDNINEGDAFVLDRVTSFDVSDLKLSVGGGAKLVTNGAVQRSFSHIISGVHPRTAFGINKEQDTAYLVCVDGRGESAGLSMEGIADFMVYLGSYNAINFDGGGSTTVVVREPGEKEVRTVNTPSDGTERRISNAIAVSDNHTASNKEAHILISFEKDYMYPGSSNTVNAVVVNEYYEPLKIPSSKIKLTSSSGQIDGNVFTATQSGDVCISAKYGSATGEAHIPVGKLVDSTIEDDVQFCKESTENPQNAFCVFGGFCPERTLFDRILNNKIESRLSAFSKKFILSTALPENINPQGYVCNYPFRAFSDHENSGHLQTFIVLDNKDNFMSGKEWQFFIKQLNEAQSKNIFIFMQTDLKFNEANEGRLFSDVLSESATNHEIYVFYNGKSAGAYTKNGVKYISTGGFYENINASNFLSDADTLTGISVYIDENDTVYYSFLPIF